MGVVKRKDTEESRSVGECVARKEMFQRSLNTLLEKAPTPRFSSFARQSLITFPLCQTQLAEPISNTYIPFRAPCTYQTTYTANTLKMDQGDAITYNNHIRKHGKQSLCLHMMESLSSRYMTVLPLCPPVRQFGGLSASWSGSPARSLPAICFVASWPSRPLVRSIARAWSKPSKKETAAL